MGLLALVSILSLILIASVLMSLRKEHIRVEHSVSWLVAAVVLFFISTTPGVLEAIADFAGVPDVPLTLVFLAFVVFLIVLYRFSRVISDLKDSNIAMAQRLAILEYHLQTLNEKQQTTQNR